MEQTPVDREALLAQIREAFAACGPIFTALGEEVRQQIILTLLDAACTGMCVSRITECTHLSRPAVSHHLKVLKDAGIIQMYTKGTMNYYFLDQSSSLHQLIQMSLQVGDLIKQLPM